MLLAPEDIAVQDHCYNPCEYVKKRLNYAQDGWYA